jgi:enoyl-CoA hydratase/carnithine racemase
LVLATDVRFASRERAVLGQVEVGFGAIPGGGPASRLPGLVGRGRTLEILLGGEDFNGELAERYGYVNRAIPDDEFDRQALADIKHFVNEVSLPADEGFPPQMDAFWKAVARPALQARASRAFEDGLQQRSDVELHLGEYVGHLSKASQ